MMSEVPTWMRSKSHTGLSSFQCVLPGPGTSKGGNILFLGMYRVLTADTVNTYSLK